MRVRNSIKHCVYNERFQYLKTLHAKVSIPSNDLSNLLSSEGYCMHVDRPTRQTPLLNNRYNNYNMITDNCTSYCI